MKTSITAPQLLAALRRRIKQFYSRVDQRLFEKCWEMVDPHIRAEARSITQCQYTAALERFVTWCGAVRICTIEPVHIHVNEPSRLYENRDFATVRVTWEDSRGEVHIFTERWVRGRRGWWYTRSSGLVVPGDREPSTGYP